LTLLLLFASGEPIKTTLSVSASAAVGVGIPAGNTELSIGCTAKLDPVRTSFSLFASAGIGIAIPAQEQTLSIGASANKQVITPAPSTIVELSQAAEFTTFVLNRNAVIRYYLTLTGSADGTTDIEIPMSSFQARRRSGEPTYLQVVIPTTDYADKIADRANGNIQIDQGYVQDGELLQRETIIETDIDTVRSDKGGNNQSVTLTGYKQQTFEGKSVTLTGSTYRSVNGGKITHRVSRPNIYLNPGDTVTIDDDTFEVGVMNYSISPRRFTLEVTEADA